jgi:hypothetical protein
LPATFAFNIPGGHDHPIEEHFAREHREAVQMFLEANQLLCINNPKPALFNPIFHLVLNAPRVELLSREDACTILASAPIRYVSNTLLEGASPESYWIDGQLHCLQFSKNRDFEWRQEMNLVP